MSTSAKPEGEFKFQVEVYLNDERLPPCTSGGKYGANYYTLADIVNGQIRRLEQLKGTHLAKITGDSVKKGLKDPSNKDLKQSLHAFGLLNNTTIYLHFVTLPSSAPSH